MISIVVCSNRVDMFQKLKQNIERTIGTPFEIVQIENTNNQYSIFKAYNLGIELSKGEYICFVHTDVVFHTNNWGEKIIKHLANERVGIVGFAGGSHVTQIPDSWKEKHAAINIIQSDTKTRKPARKIVLPLRFEQTKKEVILLDGVFLGCSKLTANKVKFDEQFQGFHCYDLDICLQTYTSGLFNYVVYDIEIEHLSKGNRSKEYFENLLQLYSKWEQALPLTLSKSTKPTYFQLNLKLIRLFYKLVARGFSQKATTQHIRYYAQKIKPYHLFRVKIITFAFDLAFRMFVNVKTQTTKW